MRPSIKLDPVRLKLYRSQKGLTQRQLAELAIDSKGTKASDNRAVMYQTIERTGVTSSPRAARIAGALGVTVDDLLPGATDIKTLWWLNHSMDADLPLGSEKFQFEIGSTVLGVTEVVGEIRTHWHNHGLKSVRYGNIVRASANFLKSKFEIEMQTYQSANSIEPIRTYQYLARSIRYAPLNGLLWRDSEELERDFFTSSIKDFLFAHSSTVLIDGEAFPPEGSTQCYEVNSVELRIDEKGKRVEWVGKKYFYSEAEFHLSLGEWMQSYPLGSVKFNEIYHGISVSFPQKPNRDNKILMPKKISVRFGWIDAQEIFRVGPWPIFNRNILIKGEVDPRNYHLLCAQNANIVPFEPEMKTVILEGDN